MLTKTGSNGKGGRNCKIEKGLTSIVLELERRRRGSRAFSCTLRHGDGRTVTLYNIDNNAVDGYWRHIRHVDRLWLFTNLKEKSSRLWFCPNSHLWHSFPSHILNIPIFQDKSQWCDRFSYLGEMSYLSNRQSYHSKGKTDPCMKKSTELQVGSSSD